MEDQRSSQVFTGGGLGDGVQGEANVGLGVIQKDKKNGCGKVMIISMKR